MINYLRKEKVLSIALFLGFISCFFIHLDRKYLDYIDMRVLALLFGLIPIQRIGMLDRKLRIVNENTETYEDWLKWTIRSFEASYGYEYQGDNVLIARINLLLTFTDYYEERWQRQPDGRLLRKLANKIAWNIWQMDGLKDAVPLGKPYEEFKQMNFFGLLGIEDTDDDKSDAVPCRIFDWRRKSSLKFMDIKEK